jgi:hypothetical protein
VEGFEPRIVCSYYEIDSQGVDVNHVNLRPNNLHMQFGNTRGKRNIALMFSPRSLEGFDQPPAAVIDDVGWQVAPKKTRKSFDAFNALPE